MGSSDDLGGLDRVAANERHFLAGHRRRAAGGDLVLQCECTHHVCDRRIELTPAQYEPVRSSCARYAIYPHSGHVDAAVDRIVERRQSHWVVERQSTVEALEFFVAGPETQVTRPTSRLTDLRVAVPVSDDGPVAGT